MLLQEHYQLNVQFFVLSTLVLLVFNLWVTVLPYEFIEKKLFFDNINPSCRSGWVSDISVPPCENSACSPVVHRLNTFLRSLSLSLPPYCDFDAQRGWVGRAVKLCNFKWKFGRKSNVILSLFL